MGAGRALQRFLGFLALFAADLHGALSVPGTGLCLGLWWVEGRGSVLAVRAIQAQGLMGGFLEESVLERELVRQAGEEENSGDSWLDQKPRGPRHLLCLTHKETESQREGLVGLC